MLNPLLIPLVPGHTAVAKIFQKNPLFRSPGKRAGSIYMGVGDNGGLEMLVQCMTVDPEAFLHISVIPGSSWVKFIVAHECNWPRTKKMCVGSLVFVDCRVSAFATFSQVGLCPPSMLGRREILQTEPGSGYHTIPRAGPAPGGFFILCDPLMHFPFSTFWWPQ